MAGGNKISVITVIYNLVENGRVESFREMMNSVTSQTYNNFEHVIVDGGSSDGTINIVQAFLDSSKKIKFLSEKDDGIYDAMNKGARLSSGDYLVFINSDDYYNNNQFFEECIKSFRMSSKDFVYTDSQVLKGNFKLKTIKPDLKRFCYTMPFGHQSLMINKRVFYEIGCFDANYSVAADFKFVLKLMLGRYTGQYLPGKFVTYRAGGASFSTNNLSDERSKIIYETYGREEGLTLEDCKAILAKEIGPEYFKIITKIQKSDVKKSLKHKINFRYFRKWLFSCRYIDRGFNICFMGHKFRF